MYRYHTSSSSTSLYNPDAAAPLSYIPVSKYRTLHNKVKIHYKEAGAGSDNSSSTILLLHETPSNSSSFRNLIPVLASSCNNGGFNMHVIAPDLPGFGATQTPPGYSFTFDKIAETLVLLLDSLGVSQFVLYGAGEYGTALALRLMPFKQGKVQALILQNGSIFYDDRTDPKYLNLYRDQEEDTTPSASIHLPGLDDALPTSNNSLHVPLKSCFKNNSSTNSLSSLSSESSTSNIDLIGVPISRSQSKVSFSGVINEFTFDKQNNLSVTTSFSSRASGSPEEEYGSSVFDSESPTSSKSSSPENGLSLEFQEPVKKTAVTDTMISFDEFKKLYHPTKPITSSLRSKPSFYSFSADEPTIIDPLFYTFDYALLQQNLSAEAHRMLYNDYLSLRKKLQQNASVWLRTINIPLLVLWGTNSVLAQGNDDSICESYKRDARICQVEKIDNVGHFPLELALDKVVDSMGRFFKQHINDGYNNNSSINGY